MPHSLFDLQTVRTMLHVAIKASCSHISPGFFIYVRDSQAECVCVSLIQMMVRAEVPGSHISQVSKSSFALILHLQYRENTYISLFSRINTLQDCEGLDGDQKHEE